MSGMHSIWGHLLGIVVGSAWVLTANCATAQIRPDRTLPNNSTVTMNGSIFNITGGTQAGRNLFHSFQQFSIPTGGKAIFNNGLDIQNIFSRVTGGSVSSIDGVIQANGTANVFFLNPNGIVFGKNASLSIGGSFVATTANAIQFGNLGTFSASVPNSPALLTVNPSALLYNQIAASASIQNSSTAPASKAPTGANSFGLNVPDGKSLLLVGGDINMDGGKLSAYGGHVELAGLTAPGTVGLAVNGNNLSLSFPVQSTRGSVSLLNKANVTVAAGDGGSITVNASNLNITGGSQLIAGIAPGLGNVGAKAGDITINATGDIKLDGSGSRIADNVGANNNNQNSSTKGNGGNIEINTNQLELTKGAQLVADTNGKGNAGSVIINATKSVSLDGNNTFVSSRVQNTGVGNASNIQVNTGQLSLTSSAQLLASTLGQGNAGDVIINATKSVSLDGSYTNSINNNIVPSGIFSRVGAPNAQNNLVKGNGGNIQITTDQLSLSDGARLVADTYAKGNAGNVIINATKSVSLDGNNTFVSGRVQNTGVGNAGNIQVNTGQLSLTNGAQLIASTLGQGNAGDVIINATKSVSLDGNSSGIFSKVQSAAVGNAGNIQITTDQLSLSNDAQLVANTLGQGNAGNVIINANKSVSLNGNNTLVLSRVENTGVGNAGNIQIKTGQLSLTNDAQLIASTLGQGNAGNVIINATKSVSLDGSYTDSKGNFVSSGIFSRVGSPKNAQNNLVKGNGGNIQITTDQLSLSDGAQLVADTYGKGNAGNVIINATKSISLVGNNSVSLDGNNTAIYSRVQPTGVGNAGNIQINTDQLSLTNGAALKVNSLGQGNAGNLEIEARSVRLDNGASLGVDTTSGQGDITIHSQGLILLSRGSNITANARGTNVIGGNINIDTDILAVVENSKISADSSDFRGGQIGINAQSIFPSPDSSITAHGVNQQLNGTVQIKTPDIDSTRGLVILPTVAAPNPKLVSSNCAAFNEYAGGSSFNITGRGGLPPTPHDPLISEALWTDTRLPIAAAQKHYHKTHAVKPKPQPVAIIPATGWVFNDKGEVILISTATNATSVSTPTSCPTR